MDGTFLKDTFGHGIDWFFVVQGLHWGESGPLSDFLQSGEKPDITNLRVNIQILRQ